jgi:hypothetical protein
MRSKKILLIKLPSVSPTGAFLFMYYGLKSVSPVPSKQSPAENERFIVIQLKPLLKFAFTGLDQEGEINPCRLLRCPTSDNRTILKKSVSGLTTSRHLDSVTVCG